MSQASDVSMTAGPILELDEISKEFPGIQALHAVSLQVFPGEVLCLLGDNGAGKSTLIRIMSGVIPPTAGSMRVDGSPIVFSGPRDAQRRGISTVHQQVGLLPLMSIVDNFFLGVEPTKGWGPIRWFDRKTAKRVALEEIRAIGLTRVDDSEQLAGTLSGGERQALAIARAMYFGARLLILDEPTSALGVKEAAKVLKLIVQARSLGRGIVFITHNAQHAMSVGDRFVVLSHGAIAAMFARNEKRREEVLNLMAGGEEMESLELELEEVRKVIEPVRNEQLENRA